MITGSCLCGAVRFTIERKASGSAGLLDDDPGMRSDEHIFVELESPWFAITDDLPQLDEAALVALRRSQQRS